MFIFCLENEKAVDLSINVHFGQKRLFWSKTSILVKNVRFGQKRSFWSKTLIFLISVRYTQNVHLALKKIIHSIYLLAVSDRVNQHVHDFRALDKYPPNPVPLAR